MSFSQVQVVGSQANPDYVYYNATVVNNTVQTTQLSDDPAITFQDTRQNPIIKDSSQYNVSVLNFSLNGATKTLPVFIPQIQVGTAINNTVYSVSFSAYSPSSGGAWFNSTQFIQWEPENIATYTVVPQTATPRQSESDYYYCYTYTQFVKLINKALQNAYTDVTTSINSVYGTAASAPTSIVCPFVEFDETTGLFSINQDSNTSIVPTGITVFSPYNVASGSTAISTATGAYTVVGMNSNLEGLISNWENIYYGASKTFFGSTTANSYTNGTGRTATSTLATGTACPLPEVVISNGMSGFDLAVLPTYQPVGVSLKSKPSFTCYNPINPFDQTTIGNNIIRQTESNISTGSLWSPIASFVIGTNTIPVRMEENANPVVIGQGNVGGESGVAGSFQKVLIETPINAITADLWRGWVLYEPLIPTYSSLDAVHDGISQLDFQMYWRNRLTNSLVPLRLYNTGTMNIRLLFRRKGISS